MTDSLRHQILAKIQQAYQAIQPPDTSTPGYAPSAADWPFAFSTVEIGPLSHEDQRKRYSIGIVVGQERESYLFPYIQCHLAVHIEFRVTVNQGDSKPGVVAEQVLTVVKRVVDVDRTWGASRLTPSASVRRSTSPAMTISQSWACSCSTFCTGTLIQTCAAPSRIRRHRYQAWPTLPPRAAPLPWGTAYYREQDSRQ